MTVTLFPWLRIAWLANGWWACACMEATDELLCAVRGHWAAPIALPHLSRVYLKPQVTYYLFSELSLHYMQWQNTWMSCTITLNDFDKCVAWLYAGHIDVIPPAFPFINVAFFFPHGILIAHKHYVFCHQRLSNFSKIYFTKFILPFVFSAATSMLS